jgi:hypothetical protein
VRSGKDPTFWKAIAVFQSELRIRLVVHSCMMQLLTEEGWSIVTNKKRVGLLVLVGGDGPDPAPLVP